ncbi:MAG: type II toxin-antitoxin system RelE/ParE family toxin [Bacteroidaceae bacterium]|nr:type II toxin-antitoxin system RelE/ParE family toxin [Bacteroidaceae bacterium]
MIVKWTKQAEQALDEIADFVLEEYGWDACDRFLYRVQHMAKLLEKHPHLGPIEPLLANRPMMYRSVVVGRLNKLVYRIFDNQIKIVDFWDARREPNAQAEQVN